MARKKKKSFAVGDTVYAINPQGEVIEATIKSINTEDMCPYELDLKTKLRFYTADDLYSFREEAEMVLAKLDGQRVQRELDSGNPCSGCVPAGYDKRTHTFLDGTGKRISEFFEASPEIVDQYSKLISKVCSFCHKHSIPVVTVACMKRTKKGEVAFLNSSILPSARVPDILWDVDEMFRYDDDEEE